MSFLNLKIREQESRASLVWGCWYQWEDMRKGYRRANMVQKLCTHVCKWKNGPVETIPGIGGKGNKGE
jgi:hypothetical protein